jgi:hypothetical protein
MASASSSSAVKSSDRSTIWLWATTCKLARPKKQLNPDLWLFTTERCPGERRHNTGRAGERAEQIRMPPKRSSEDGSPHSDAELDDVLSLLGQVALG